MQPQKPIGCHCSVQARISDGRVGLRETRKFGATNSVREVTFAPGGASVQFDLPWPPIPDVSGKGLSHFEAGAQQCPPGVSKATRASARVMTSLFCFIPKALTKLAKKMIYTGFVKHRAFDACFEMGNGGEVMAGLITEATQNDILRREIIRCEDYIGAWETLAAKHLGPASLGGLFAGEAA